MSDNALQLHLRHQELRLDQRGRSYWEIIAEEAALSCASTAILLCDVWDRHWSRGATERVDGMVGLMDRVAVAARGCGMQIIHAPSDTMDFYADHPASVRVAQARGAWRPGCGTDTRGPTIPCRPSGAGTWGACRVTSAAGPGEGTSTRSARRI